MVERLSRRTVLGVVGAGGFVPLSGCSDIIDGGPESTPNSADEEAVESAVPTGEKSGVRHQAKRYDFESLPFSTNLRRPSNILVNERGSDRIPQLLPIEVHLNPGSVAHDPSISVVLQNATITEILPGDFPINAKVQNSSKKSLATGQGVERWEGPRTAVFGVVFEPRPSVDGIPTEILLSVQEEQDGEIMRGRIAETLPTSSRPSNGLSPEVAHSMARQRARICRRFGEFLANSSSSFDERGQAELRDGLLTVSLGAAQIYADKAVGEVLGITGVGEYIWTTYIKQFKSPFHYLLEGSVPSDPEQVNEVPSSHYGPPFFSALLTNAQSLFEEYMALFENHLYEVRRAEAGATVLLSVMASLAAQEATAWRRGDVTSATQLLADQAVALGGLSSENPGLEGSGPDGRPGEVEDRFLARRHRSNSHDLPADEYPDLSKNLIDHVRVLRYKGKDVSRYQNAVAMLEAMDGFLTGELNRIESLAKYIENGELGATANGRAPSPEIQSVEVPDSATTGEQFTTRVRVKNTGARGGHWSTITLSFPELTDPTASEQLRIAEEDFGEWSTVITSGDAIKDSDNNSISAEYALAEAGTDDDSYWKSGATHSLTVTVIPEESGRFPINVRGTLTSEDNVTETYNAPGPDTTDYTDQQGYPVRRVAVNATRPDPDPAPKIDSVSIPDDVPVGRRFRIIVEATNAGGKAGPWSTISVSFPSLTDRADASQVTIRTTSFAEYSEVASPGTPIRTKGGEDMDARYVLAEAGTDSDSHWEGGSSKWLSLVVEAESTGSFPVLVRTTLTDPEDISNKFTKPTGVEADTTDQQGYSVSSYNINVYE